MAVEFKKIFFHRRFLFPFIALITAFAIWETGFLKQTEPPSTVRRFPIMGTVAETILYGDKRRTEAAARLVYDKFMEVSDICDIFEPESELSKLNRTAYLEPFKCSPLLWDILKTARNAYKLSDGAFDVTAKPLMELWGFYRKRKKLPSKAEIESTLARVGFDKVILDDSDMSVRFTVPGMSIDLGGVAKGYAVDLAADAAKAAGIRSGLINLAGNMYCFPVAPEGRECFTVGVRNPLRKDRVCGTIQLLNTSVATSGNYERFVNIAGHNYAHIMNPVTGRPVSGRLSVTVVTPLAVYADILSTSIYIKGEKFARRVRAEMPATSALIIECAPEDSSEYRIIPLGNTWGDINHSL